MTTSLIAQAVEPLREAAIARAEKEARNFLLSISKKLEENNYDRNAFAPYPKGTDYSGFSTKKAWYELVRRVTNSNWPGSRSPKDPDIAKMDFDVSYKFVEQQKKDASFEYDAFIAKLESKIGEVVSAELEGDHVWGYSFLTVEKADGSKEKWKTQMIVNVSKHGKLFNQFPTRKVK